MNYYSRLLIVLFQLLGLMAIGQEKMDSDLLGILQENLDFQLLVQADSGNVANVRKLIDVGANPNASSWDGTTALMYTSHKGHYSTALELIANYADPNKSDENSFTALHYATINNHDSIAELLMLNGAEPHPTAYNGVSPLHYASAYGYPFLAYLLIEYGAYIDSTDKYGNTPLLMAVYNGSLVTTELLLEQWAAVDKSDNNGFTPLMVAAQFNDTTIMRLLLDYGANMFEQNLTGGTALAIAMQNKATEAIGMLMLEGAVKKEYSTEYSYADLAHRNGYAEFSSILQKLGNPLIKKPYVNAFTISSGLTLNGNDFYLLINTSLKLSTAGLRFGSTVGFRPYYKAINVDTEYIVYQFFEQRNYASLYTAIDVVEFHGNNGLSYGLSAGLMGLFSWGKYSIDSDSFKAKTYLKASPFLELFYLKNGFTLSVNGYYNKMIHTKKQPVFVEIKCGYTFDLTKPKIRLKKIEWL
ncbi:MAG: ankyrin repeat domain-containing protein [Bacteroidales bacterium]|nr:ankyrin repeat domain-containing protein [Bacteroidales bacterium]MDD3892225.1 ankyrin repeat domain-containing protein [Bacteroidales bacterium]